MTRVSLGAVTACAVVFVASTATAAETAPAAPASPPSAPTAAAHPVGTVHIDAPERVDLQLSNGDGEWDVVCTSPCDRPMPLDGTYRIGGAGIRDSQSFHLDASGRTTLSVDPTSSGARTGAVVLTVVGAIGMLPVVGVSAVIAVGEVLGVILICPLAAAFETDKSKQAGEYGDCLGGIASFFAPAYGQPSVWVPGIAGAVLFTGGLVWLAGTPRTQVQRTSATNGAIPLDLRPTSEAIRLPRPVVYPVLQAHF